MARMFLRLPARTFLLMFVLLLVSTRGKGQQGLKKEIEKYKGLVRYVSLDKCYRLNGYDYYWIRHTSRQEALMRLLARAQDYGLEEKDYQYGFFQSFKKNGLGTRTSDSAAADILFTDAALHFLGEVRTGNRPPGLRYDGLGYAPDISDIPQLLHDYLEGAEIKKLTGRLQPATPEILAIARKLDWIRQRKNDSNFREVKVLSHQSGNANSLLLLKLYQLGVTDTLDHTINDRELSRKIKEAQELFDIFPDGVLRGTTLQALNIPLQRRETELTLALNYLKWLRPLTQQAFVLIGNIPSASFVVYDRDSVVLDSKLIVGKSSTPTPTLSSTLTELVLYPYWMVPKKIATRELLPSIKKNIGFLELGNFQVINRQGRVLDPYAINWRAFSTSYFPYVLRQSTGCDNSLGIVKFNFYNPFAVYLHDTPGKTLFSFHKRYFSHGCLRVEKPLELAHLVLGDNRMAIDTLTEKGCLEHQSPLVVPVKRGLPLIILYSTVWYTKSAGLKFYEDIYRKLEP